ncbi:hypothetical protein [Streptomyces albogriseolus]|uniref:hypothetical protein n=1 Tax=Streptomyces albogriseolus TaxID=1887 RepID=UPI0033AEB792
MCEHAFVHLKNWRVLTKLRLDVKWATRLVRALLVLNQHEISRRPTISTTGRPGPSVELLGEAPTTGDRSSGAARARTQRWW